MSLQILNYTAEIYDIYGNFSSFIVTQGWVNITNITSGTHYARVFNATGTNATYYERTVSFDSPANVTMYLPPTSTGLLIVFVLNDYTGDYPYLSTTLTVARNGTAVYSSLFGADAKIPTYLSQGISYTITLTNDNNIIIWGNYLPYVSTEVSIAVTTKVIPQGALNYNISNNPSSITLQWNAESGNFVGLNFTVYNAITGALLDSTTTSLTTGEYNYAKGVNNLSYYVVFNGSTLNDGIFIKKTTFDDRTACEKAPGTMICKNDFMSYGTYTISDSWRYSISIIGLILLAVSFTIYFAYEGAIITLIFANFLYYWEWLPHMSFLGLDTGQGLLMVLLVLALIMLGKNKGD
jgi:hypothetical protein